MNLRYTLPDREQALCHAALQKEKIIYCVPYDLTLDGHYCADGYVVITKKHLLLLAEGQIKESIALGPDWEIRASSQIDNGLLVGRHDGQEYPLCRFQHAAQWSASPMWPAARMPSAMVNCSRSPAKNGKRAARAAAGRCAVRISVHAVTGTARECAASPSWENPTWGLFC